MPTIVAVAGLAASVVTLITQSDDALRRLAESLARWRRTAKPEAGKAFSLFVRRGKQRVVAIELDQEPDPDALLAFLRSALAQPEGMRDG